MAIFSTKELHRAAKTREHATKDLLEQLDAAEVEVLDESAPPSARLVA